MKDHEIAQLVNDLTQVAREFGATQQLRERIAAVIVPVLKKVPDGRRQEVRGVPVKDYEGLLP